MAKKQKKLTRTKGRKTTDISSKLKKGVSPKTARPKPKAKPAAKKGITDGATGVKRKGVSPKRAMGLPAQPATRGKSVCQRVSDDLDLNSPTTAKASADRLGILEMNAKACLDGLVDIGKATLNGATYSKV